MGAIPSVSVDLRDHGLQPQYNNEDRMHIADVSIVIRSRIVWNSMKKFLAFGCC